jgi:hypothetical protein
MIVETERSAANECRINDDPGPVNAMQEVFSDTLLLASTWCSVLY